MKILLLLLLLSGCSKVIFDLEYSCDGNIGTIHHIVHEEKFFEVVDHKKPTNVPAKCQMKNYAIIHDLSQVCKEVVIHASYCGEELLWMVY